MTELERPGGATPARAPKRERRWLWVVAGIFVIVGKGEAIDAVTAHRTDLIVAAAVALVVGTVVRPSPLTIAAVSGVLLATVLAPPFLVGAGIALGAFVLLMTLFYGLAIVLHARQDRPATHAGG